MKDTWYSAIGTEFLDHVTVNHGDKECKRGYAHTNTVEGFFSVFKRGMKGVYQHCAEKHLHRYLVEFDFRHSNRVVLGVRLTLSAPGARWLARLAVASRINSAGEARA